MKINYPKKIIWEYIKYKNILHLNKNYLFMKHYELI